MSENVADFADHRAIRNLKAQMSDLDARMLAMRFETDPALCQRVARVRLSELLIMHETLINHLRPVLLEAIELACLMTDDRADYLCAVSLVLRDNVHVKELAERLAAREAEMPAEYARLEAVGYMK